MTQQKKTLFDKLREFIGLNEGAAYNQGAAYNPLFDKLKGWIGLNEEYINEYTNEYRNKLAETKNIQVDSVEYLSLSTELKIAKIQTDIDDIKEKINNLENKIDFIIRIIYPNTIAQTLYPQLNGKLLVIEDSGVIRKTIRDFLREDGFEIIEAKDGIQGLNLIRQVHPDLIMLDFIIPRMSGWEVYQQIQADPELRSIPLIIMCGHKYEVSRQIPEPFEHFVFLSKPFDRKQLIEAIELVTGDGLSTDNL